MKRQGVSAYALFREYFSISAYVSKIKLNFKIRGGVPINSNTYPKHILLLDSLVKKQLTLDAIII